MTAQTMVTGHENKMQNLKTRLRELNQKEQNIIDKNHAWTQSLKKWLELMNKAYLLWKNANLEQKKIIAENLFLELVIKDGKIASYKYLDAPAALKNANLLPSGGRGGT